MKITHNHNSLLLMLNNNELNAKVSDTTGDDQSDAVDNKKYPLLTTNLFLPCQHTAFKIYCIFKTCLFHKKTGNATAVTTSAINNYFFIFPVIEVIKLHGLYFTKRHVLATNIEVCFFIIILFEVIIVLKLNL